MACVVVSLVAGPSALATTVHPVDPVDNSYNSSAATAISQNGFDIFGRPAIDPSGGVWVPHSEGVFRLDNKGDLDISVSSDSTRAIALDQAEAADGAVFVALWRFDTSFSPRKRATRVERLLADGSSATPPVVPVPEVYGDIDVLASLPDGSLLYGGRWEANGGTRAIGRVRPDGTPDTTFNDNAATLAGSPLVRDIAVDSDGKIYLAVEGLTAPVLRLLPDGQPDTDYNTNVEVHVWGTGHRVAIHNGGVVIAGGEGWSGLTIQPGPNETYRNLARLTNTGVLDTGFAANIDELSKDDWPPEIGTCSLPNEEVWEVVVSPVGDIVLAGGFMQCPIDDPTGDYVAPFRRLSSAGEFISQPADFSSDSGDFMPVVRNLLVHPMGGLIAVGESTVQRFGPPALSPGTQTVTGTTGTAISASIAFTTVGFDGAVTYTVSAGTLPTGLTLNASTGVISGMPTAASTDTVTITGNGATAGTATATVSFAIVAAPTSSAPEVTVPPAPTTAAPEPTPPASGPTFVTPDVQAALTQAPGSATALVDGQPVEVVVRAVADSAGAQIAPENRTPEQVAELQQAAEALTDRLAAVAGGDMGVEVIATDTGAELSGVFPDTNVPVEDVIVVDIGVSATLFAARNIAGDIIKVQPGAVLEVTPDGEVAVLAYGLPVGDPVELVLMSTPTLLGTFVVDANGGVETRVNIPDSIGSGNHTLVVASPDVQASLGLRVSDLTGSAASAQPNEGTLPTTGTSLANGLVIVLIAMGALLVLVARGRREVAVR